MPTRPDESRKAINCSPSSLSRNGAPSGASSDDISAGSQYCRMSSPIGVPGPTLVKTSESVAIVIYVFPSSRRPRKGALVLLLKPGIKPAAAMMLADGRCTAQSIGRPAARCCLTL
jgi:hypothetical protein